jgi:DNA-3-methyladenine glycosylase II
MFQMPVILPSKVRLGFISSMKKALDYLSEKDKILHHIIENFGNPIVQKRAEGFSAFCHIILEQQVSIASAKACYEKIQLLLGTITPETILNVSDLDLRNCGVSRQKNIYLRDLATKVNSRELDFTTFSTKSEAEIRAELIAVKGIGNWSIEVYLMFCLQSSDIIPLGDIAIKNTLKELYNCQTLDEMELVSNNWKPERTMASFVIWHYYLKKRNKI